MSINILETNSWIKGKNCKLCSEKNNCAKSCENRPKDVKYFQSQKELKELCVEELDKVQVCGETKFIDVEQLSRILEKKYSKKSKTIENKENHKKNDNIEEKKELNNKNKENKKNIEKKSVKNEEKNEKNIKMNEEKIEKNSSSKNKIEKNENKKEKKSIEKNEENNTNKNVKSLEKKNDKKVKKVKKEKKEKKVKKVKKSNEKDIKKEKHSEPKKKIAKTKKKTMTTENKKNKKTEKANKKKKIIKKVKKNNQLDKDSELVTNEKINQMSPIVSVKQMIGTKLPYDGSIGLNFGKKHQRTFANSLYKNFQITIKNKRPKIIFSDEIFPEETTWYNVSNSTNNWHLNISQIVFGLKYSNLKKAQKIKKLKFKTLKGFLTLDSTLIGIPRKLTVELKKRLQKSLNSSSCFFVGPLNMIKCEGILGDLKKVKIAFPFGKGNNTVLVLDSVDFVSKCQKQLIEKQQAKKSKLKKLFHHIKKFFSKKNKTKLIKKYTKAQTCLLKFYETSGNYFIFGLNFFENLEFITFDFQNKRFGVSVPIEKTEMGFIELPSFWKVMKKVLKIFLIILVCILGLLSISLLIIYRRKLRCKNIKNCLRKNKCTGCIFKRIFKKKNQEDYELTRLEQTHDDSDIHNLSKQIQEIHEIRNASSFEENKNNNKESNEKNGTSHEIKNEI